MKLKKEQIECVAIIRKEMTKVRCWLTGYHAGTGNKHIIAGEDSLRQAIILFDEIIRQAGKDE